MRMGCAIALLLMAFAGEVRARTSWPPLPASGFIAGRAATQADIQSGSAAFVMAQGAKTISTPLPLKIPQYAYLNQAGKRVPVILIQAEEANGMQVVGVLMADGSTSLGLLSELELLGSRLPSQAPGKPVPPWTGGRIK